MSTLPRYDMTEQPEFLHERIRNVVLQLTTVETEQVESETIEVKGWCGCEKELAEKVSDAAACLANAKGGLVLVGVADHAKNGSKFSECPFPNVCAEWLLQRIHDHTMPPVECSVLSISEIISSLSNQVAEGYAVCVSKSRHIGSHLTAKGISRVRNGKECRTQYAAEDDRSRVIVPHATRGDLSSVSLQWAIHRHTKHFGLSQPDASDEMDLLRQAGLLIGGCPYPSENQREGLTLASLLLFGSSEALQRHVPFFETHVITGYGTHTIKRNIVDSVRTLLFSPTALLDSLTPNIDSQILTELVVNAYVHRCYRQAGPIIIRLDSGSLEIENPGELAAGLNVSNLINCVPVYRNLLLAEGARFFGLCDKIGQGIDIIYRGVLRGGFPFPEFESEHGRFSARIPLQGSAEFREFVRRRAQSLNQLEEVIVLRRLWGHESASVDELRIAMQRGKDFADRVIGEMTRKLIIETTELSNHFRLTPVVRRDIENIFHEDQLSLEALWGIGPTLLL